jgi:glycolate oxidase FAD binding subunit
VDGETCTIDGYGPLAVVRPGGVAEAGVAVREAAAVGRAVYPVGGGTHLHVGHTPARPGIALDMTGLAAVIDYPARDMTVTVQAGIRVADLRRLLAAENQRLPVDVPLADQATLGGALAVNASGPRRLGCGTFRDYVLGLSALNDDGQETRSGGRVVKNVAGYDLHKLHVGGLGTLGVITQVTLKLRPLPESAALVVIGCRAERLGELLDLLHASRVRPVCVDVLNAAAARAAELAALPSAAWWVVAGFEDSEDAVNWQVRHLLEGLPAGVAEGVTAWAGAACEPLWRALTDLPARPATLTFRATTLPGRVAALCLKAAALAPEALLHAHAGSGVLTGHLGGDLTPPSVSAMLEGLRPELAGGAVTLPRCPPAWKATLPVWGAPRGDWPLMRRVKEALDPRGLFNPGRFVDGI